MSRNITVELIIMLFISSFALLMCCVQYLLNIIDMAIGSNSIENTTVITIYRETIDFVKSFIIFTSLMLVLSFIISFIVLLAERKLCRELKTI